MSEGSDMMAIVLRDSLPEHARYNVLLDALSGEAVIDWVGLVGACWGTLTESERAVTKLAAHVLGNEDVALLTAPARATFASLLASVDFSTRVRVVAALEAVAAEFER